MVANKSDCSLEKGVMSIINRFLPQSIKRLRYSSRLEAEDPHFRTRKKLEDAEGLLSFVSPKPCSCSSENCGYTNPASLDLSVIVPVYNNLPYLDGCIESVFQQRNNFAVEVIAVDDGSTDGSGDRLDYLASKYPDELVVVHQENKGFSGARNSGVQLARGLYLTFLDSDDYLPQGSIASLMTPAFKYEADIVGGGYWKCSASGKKRAPHRLKAATFSCESENIQLSGLPCGSVYRREIWENVRFPEGYWFEDTIIPYLIFTQAQSIVATSDLVYCYRANPKGITATSRNAKKAIDSYWIVAMLLDELEARGYSLDKRLYVQTLYQLGPLLYFRTQALAESERLLLFDACVSILRKYGGEANLPENSSYVLREIEKSLVSADYNRWRLACLMLI